MNPKQYTENLIRVQGKEQALFIAAQSFRNSLQASVITYFDEADFFINESGKYEYSKNQSGKFEANKVQRTNSVNQFWKSVLEIMGHAKETRTPKV